MKVDKITIYPGHNKDGEEERFTTLTIVSGDTISIVGPTGSGKTSFVNDIEMLTQGDTISRKENNDQRESPLTIFSPGRIFKPYRTDYATYQFSR